MSDYINQKIKRQNDFALVQLETLRSESLLNLEKVASSAEKYAIVCSMSKKDAIATFKIRINLHYSTHKPENERQGLPSSYSRQCTCEALRHLQILYLEINGGLVSSRQS